MDFHSLKRRELQALCKKYKIPANLSNLEMGKRLADFFKEKEKPIFQGRMNGEEENTSEIDSTDVVRNRQVKKVRFGPEHELIEFTRSRGMNQTHRRSFVSVGKSISSAEENDSGQMNHENVTKNGRVTRSRGSTLMKRQVNEKKRGRENVKFNEKKNNGSDVENVDKSKLKEGDIEISSRVLRSRGQKLAKDVKNVQKVRKPKDKISNGKALDGSVEEKSSNHIVDGHGRLVRSRRQKFSVASGNNSKIAERVVETVENNVHLVSAEIDGNRVVTRCSSRKRGVVVVCEDVKSDGKNGDEVLENIIISEAQNNIEPRISLRRYKRNVGKIGADGGVIHIAEPVKPEVRRSTRRKSVIASHANTRNSELTAETENTEHLRSSGPQSITADGKSKNEKGSQPAGFMRQSRRKAFENRETKKHLGEEYPMEAGTSAVEKRKKRLRRLAYVCNLEGITDETNKGPGIRQKNEVRKRKIGPPLEAGAMKITQTRSRKLSVEENRNEGISILKTQLSLPEGGDSTRVSGSGGDMKNKNITRDVGQMSGRRTHAEKQCASTVDSAKNAHMEFCDGNKFGNSADSGKQIFASKIEDNAGKLDSLECDAIIEKTGTNMDRNQSEALLFSQSKDLICINTTSGQMSQEGSIVSRSKGFDKTSSATDTFLLGNQTDVNNGLEVIEAEADMHVVDHAGDDEGIYVKKDLEYFGSGGANVISPPATYLEDNWQLIKACNKSYDNNKEDGHLKAGDDGALESCDPIGSKMLLQVKEASSSNLRSIGSNNAETEKGGYLQGNIIERNEDDDFFVPHLFVSEISGMINPQDRGIGSGEFSAMESEEQEMDKQFLVVCSMTTCGDLGNICLQRDIEADHTSKIDHGGYPNSHNRNCDEDEEFITCDILGVKRRSTILTQDGNIISDETSTGDSDDKGMKIQLSGCEADQIAERDESCACKDNKSKPGDIHEGGWLENGKYERDDDWELGVTNLFDSGNKVRDTPQVRGIIDTEQVEFYVVPAASNMTSEVKISSCSLSVQETSHSPPNSSSKSLGSGSIISEKCEIMHEAGGGLILEKGGAVVVDNVRRDEMPVHERVCDKGPEIISQQDVHTKEYIPEREEQLEIHSVVTSATKETKEDAVNDENDGKAKDDAADACFPIVETVSKLWAESVCQLEFHHTENTEHQSMNLHENQMISYVGEKSSDVESSHSWIEIERMNLFGKTHDATPTGPYYTSPRGTERSNRILSMNKSDTKSCDRLTNEEKEMEGERRRESVKTTHENAFHATKPREVSDFDPGFSIDNGDNQLQLLFETPIKIESPSKVDKTCSRTKRLEEADVSITRYVCTTEETAVARIKPDDKTRVSENQLKHSFCLESSSDGVQEINSKAANEVLVGFVNTSTVFLSEATQWHLNEGTTFFLEEASGNGCQWTGLHNSSLSGTPRNLDKLEGGKDYTDLSKNISNGDDVCFNPERKLAQSNGAESKLPNDDIQKSNLLQNSLHATAGHEDFILRKMLSVTIKDPANAEEANFGGSNGTSSSILSKASVEDDEVTKTNSETVDDEDDVPYEAKMMGEKADNLRPSDHIFDKSHSKIEVEPCRSPSVNKHSLELESTCKETGTITPNMDNILPAAGQGCSVSGAEFDVFRSSATNLLLGVEDEECEISEARTPVLNFGGEQSTSMKVHLSHLELQLEEKAEDSNKNDQNVSCEVTDNENGAMEKSAVGTPLLDEEGDNVKNDKEIEGGVAGEAVPFPVPDFHLQEQFVQSKNDVPASSSNVADMIEVYIGSECACINEGTLCEDGSHTGESFRMKTKELEEAVHVNVHVGGYAADTSSVETKSEEQTKHLLFKESLIGEEMVEYSPAIVPLGGNSGSEINKTMPLQKVEIELADGGHISSISQLCSTSKKNVRTILIHGTPSKVPKMTDMKENAPAHKNSVLDDFTAARPAKRKALQDVQWK